MMTQVMISFLEAVLLTKLS